MFRVDKFSFNKIYGFVVHKSLLTKKVGVFPKIRTAKNEGSMASAPGPVAGQPQSFSQAVSSTLKQYRKDIGFMAVQHGEIEKAKGNWLLLYKDYKAGKFPTTNAKLQTKMTTETDAYLDLESATAKAKALQDRFDETITYTTRAKICPDCHLTYQRSRYKVESAKKEEDLLSNEQGVGIVSKLRDLRERVYSIWYHMSVRLPKAGDNLGGAFYYAYGKLGQTGWGSVASSCKSWLDLAIGARKPEYTKLRAESADDSKEASASSAIAVEKELTPEEENAALAKLSQELDTAIEDDPFSREAVPSHIRKSSSGSTDEDSSGAGAGAGGAVKGSGKGAGAGASATDDADVDEEPVVAGAADDADGIGGVEEAAEEEPSTDAAADSGDVADSGADTGAVEESADSAPPSASPGPSVEVSASPRAKSLAQVVASGPAASSSAPLKPTKPPLTGAAAASAKPTPPKGKPPAATVAATAAKAGAATGKKDAPKKDE